MARRLADSPWSVLIHQLSPRSEAPFVALNCAPRPIQLAPETLDVLMRYDYPGNVRELEHIIQRSLTLARSSVLHPRDLPEEVARNQGSDAGQLRERLDAMERALLVEALEHSDWPGRRTTRHQ